MEKNSITENDIRATLSGGKNISEPKFIVLLILLCICFLGTLASGVMIIINELFLKKKICFINNYFF